MESVEGNYKRESMHHHIETLPTCPLIALACRCILIVDDGQQLVKEHGAGKLRCIIDELHRPRAGEGIISASTWGRQTEMHH